MVRTPKIIILRLNKQIITLRNREGLTKGSSIPAWILLQHCFEIYFRRPCFFFLPVTMHFLVKRRLMVISKADQMLRGQGPVRYYSYWQHYNTSSEHLVRCFKVILPWSKIEEPEYPKSSVNPQIFPNPLKRDVQLSMVPVRYFMTNLWTKRFLFHSHVLFTIQTQHSR